MCFSSIEQLNCFNWTIELPYVGRLNHFLSPFYVRTNAMLESIFDQLKFQHAQLENFPLYANSHTALQIASIGCEFVYLLLLCKAGLRYVGNLV